MDADPIQLLNDAAMQCVTYGRKPVTGWVGAEAFGEIVRRLRLHARWESPERLILYTAAGLVGIEVRSSLCDHVIVEDDTGEPWIA